MELHTLGVDGGYTQDDVITLARVLTGWGFNRADGGQFPDHAALFEGARHDFGPKVFLGRTLRARGKAEGEEALDILAARRPRATSASSSPSILSPTPRPPSWSTGWLRGFWRPAAISAKS